MNSRSSNVMRGRASARLEASDVLVQNVSDVVAVVHQKADSDQAADIPSVGGSNLHFCRSTDMIERCVNGPGCRSYARRKRSPVWGRKTALRGLECTIKSSGAGVR